MVQQNVAVARDSAYVVICVITAVIVISRKITSYYH